MVSQQPVGDNSRPKGSCVEDDVAEEDRQQLDTVHHGREANEADDAPRDHRSSFLNWDVPDFLFGHGGGDDSSQKVDERPYKTQVNHVDAGIGGHLSKTLVEHGGDTVQVHEDDGFDSV